jgi:general secretion pathway protein L
MSTLILTLPLAPPEASSLYDYVLTQDGSTVAAQSRAPLALLPKPGESGEVLVMLPACALSWHQLQLPKGSLTRGWLKEGGASRLRAVLDGLLEDRVLDETADLHFAIEPRPLAEAPVWVAACDRAWLRAGLQALEQAGLRVSRIVPEFAPDAQDQTLYVIGEPERAQLVCRARAGVAVWPLSASAVALLAGDESTQVLAEPALAAQAEQLFKRPVSLQQSAQRSLQAMASGWDLAQFDFANSGGARTWKRLSQSFTGLLREPRWRAARWALLALLGINLLGLNAWAWKQQDAVQARRTAVDQVLTSSFPQVRMVVDAPLQMAREVAKLNQASGMASARDLEVMLDAFASAAPPHTVPEALEFVSGELRLRGLRLKADELAALTLKLKGQGYSLSTEGDSVLLKQVGGS